MSENAIGWKEILKLLSPAGQQQIVVFVRQAREQRGAGWLEEIKREFPTFSWIVELVCSRTAEEAYGDLQAEYSTYPLWMIKPQLIGLHGVLRTEIEKPRG